jgi:hypothetical protein
MESVTRIGGSGFTTMLYQNQRLAYLQVIKDTPPTPVAQAQAVQPIDESVPLEIVTAMAVGVGTLTCTFYELWNEPVWAELPGLQGTTDLLDVLKRQVTLGQITMQKAISSPSGLYRAKVYHNVVIVDIDAGEQITIGTMTIPRTMTFQYCYSTAIGAGA